MITISDIVFRWSQTSPPIIRLYRPVLPKMTTSTPMYDAGSKTEHDNGAEGHEGGVQEGWGITLNAQSAGLSRINYIPVAAQVHSTTAVC